MIKALSVISLIASALAAGLNIAYLIRSLKSFRKDFYKKYESYDLKKTIRFEKEVNIIYERSDRQIEMLKKSNIVSLILLKQAAVSFAIAACGLTLFFLGAHNVAKTDRYFSVFAWSALAAFLITFPLLMGFYVKRIKEFNIRCVFKDYSGYSFYEIPYFQIGILCFAISFSVAAVIATAHVLFGF